MDISNTDYKPTSLNWSSYYAFWELDNNSKYDCNDLK